MCNRCELNRIHVGKTIMSQHELESFQESQYASKDQINLLCDLAMQNAVLTQQSHNFEHYGALPAMYQNQGAPYPDRQPLIYPQSSVPM